jgi:predicted transcriptional regulator
MNKQELKQYIKKSLAMDVFFNIELIDKKVYFSLDDFHNREVCFIEISYKNRLDKKEIYEAIANLITKFDFSFRVTFTSTQEIYEFLK